MQPLRVSNPVAWLTVAALLFSVAACESAGGFARGTADNVTNITLAWNKATTATGATRDPAGDVLITGGSVEGPTGAGGQAAWTATAAARQADKLALTIYTNGARWYGKGIHSTQTGGTVGIYVKDVLVHTITCDRRGEYGDYWPQEAPAGRPSYATGAIGVSGLGINGPTLTIKIVAGPHTAVDVNRIEVTVAAAKK